MSPSEQPQPSYEELAALVVGLTSQLEWAHGRIAELEARLGRDAGPVGGQDVYGVAAPWRERHP